MLSLKDGGFGCCPMPSAVCCKDGTHCCPHGTNCNTEKGTCDSVAANLVSALSTSNASTFSFCCVQVQRRITRTQFEEGGGSGLGIEER